LGENEMIPIAMRIFSSCVGLFSYEKLSSVHILKLSFSLEKMQFVRTDESVSGRPIFFLMQVTLLGEG
jgi:hypothetical protein